MGRVRTIKNARELLPQFKHFCNDAKLTLAKQNPIIKIEIGCGKGIFLLTHATHSPQTHFYGVEIIPTIIYKALNKIQQSELARPINNLWLLNIDANDLTKWFKPESIDTIYLNFSDPWPKSRHEKYRLTHQHFLKIYLQILKNKGVIEIKTDQPSLYTYTLAQIKLFKNLRLIYQTENLYQDQNALINNIPTEYETKFVQQGKPIYQIKLQKLN